MKHFKKTLLACYLLSVSSTFAQLEQKHWFFGDRQALDFTTSGPVYDNSAFVNNTMDTQESCVTQSDAAGNLIFYSNGESIWDGNHTLVATSIGGDLSSASGHISVPDPANPNQYYLITTSISYGNKYRIVTHLGGGSISISPAIAFPSGGGYFPFYGEGVTAVAGCNNNAWIIIKGYGSGGLNLLSFSLTSSGLSYNSAIPLLLDTDYTSLEASPDGNHIALGGFSGDNRLVMLDFDKFSGTFTNQRLLGTVYDYGSWPYGLSFSPDSKLLYAYIEGYGRIYQFEVANPNPASTAVHVGTTGGAPGQKRNTLQLGIDGKIYIPQDWSMQLAVIDNPNNQSTVLSPNNCNFTNSGPLVYNTAAHTGLPNMMDANVYTTFANTISYNLYNCLTAGFIANACAQSYSWDFGDPASGASNYSSGTSPFHTFSAPGTYTVTLNAAGTLITTTVNIDYNLTVSGTDSVCISTTGYATYTVGALAPGQTVSWSVSGGTPTGVASLPVYGIVWTSLPGTVTATVSDSYGCSSTTSMTVYDGCIVAPCSCDAAPDFQYTVDDKCEFKFQGINKASDCMESINYSWDFGDGTTATGQYPVHSFPSNGIYNVCLTVTAYYNGEMCEKTFCRKVEVKCEKSDCDCKLSPSFTYSMDYKLCEATFVADAGAPKCLNVDYKWYFGDGSTGSGQTATHIYTNPGTYTVCLVVEAFNGTDYCKQEYCMEISHDCSGKPEKKSVTADIKKGSSVAVYPNPARTEVTVSLDKQLAGNVVIRILGTDGKLLSSSEYQMESGKQLIPVVLPVSAANGMLLMEIESDGELSVQRITVIK